ncbi:MAG: hypothetical protein GYA69_05685, partial [Candidatus Moranbacteria bacterium]|nr:hypothetical protein [Candidatus Moranbacteria bacterium]
NIVLVIALIGHFGVLGLAIAFSFASILNMALLLIFLKRNLPDIDGKIILGSTAKIVAASVIGGAVAQVAKYVVGSRGELDTFVAVFTQLVVAGLAGAMAFAIASYYFKIKEFFQFTESVTKKLFKAKKVIQEDTGEVTGI